MVVDPEQDTLGRNLIQALLDENPDYSGMCIPEDRDGQRRMLRGLMNIRPAGPIPERMLRMQDEYLSMRREEKGVVDAMGIPEIRPRIRLWQGDITRLKVDGIVNAANSGMTGCYSPNHGCIDNCIHTFAGMQLRMRCSEEMRAQGHPEPVGSARITPGYNLPSGFVIHTVGPMVDGCLEDHHCRDLESCYRSCIEMARDHGLRSLAFCCISTGVFGFPRERAAEIAVDTVTGMLNDTDLEIVFNVFDDRDREIYEGLLG